jgi:hypothetical protein
VRVGYASSADPPCNRSPSSAWGALERLKTLTRRSSREPPWCRCTPCSSTKAPEASASLSPPLSLPLTPSPSLNLRRAKKGLKTILESKGYKSVEEAVGARVKPKLSAVPPVKQEAA